MLREARHDRAHAARDGDRVRARLPLDGEHDGAVAIEPRGALVVLHVVEHEPDIAEADGGAVAIRDHQGPELGRVLELPVRLHRVGAMWAPENARRQVDVAGGDAAGDLVDPELTRGQRLWIYLDPPGLLPAAVHLPLRP